MNLIMMILQFQHHILYVGLTAPNPDIPQTGHVEQPNPPPKQEVNPPKPTETKWYKLLSITPAYITFATEGTFPMIFFVVTHTILLVFLLLPYDIFEGAQNCMVTGLGMFYWSAQILSKPFSHIPVFAILFSCISFIISLGVCVISVNEKFSNLFLSISGAYIVTLLLTMIFNIVDYTVTVLLSLPIAIGFIFLKKVKASIHYSIIKSVVIGMGFFVILNALPILNFLINFYAPDGIYLTTRIINLVILVSLCCVVFIYTHFGINIKNFFLKK